MYETSTTVDGRTPAPVDVLDIPVFKGFCTCQVVQDFFLQHYLWNLDVAEGVHGYSDVPGRKLGSMVRINGLFHLLILVGGFNPSEKY